MLCVVTALTYLSRTRHRNMSPAYNDAQDLVEGVKSGDLASIDRAADLLAQHPWLRGFSGMVTPAPRSNVQRVSLIELAQALVRRGIGSRAVVTVRRARPVESSRARRRLGLEGVPYTEHLASMEMVGCPRPGEPVLVVDDILTTGATLRAAADHVRRCHGTGPILGAAVGRYEPEPSRGAFEPAVTEV